MEVESQNLSDEQIDSLLEGGDKPSANIPMKDAPTQEASPWTEDKFLVGGKEIKGTREQILKWAEMGHGYPQRMAELNKKLQGYESEKSKWQEIEQKFSPYKQVDEYAQKNPDWWSQVQQAYQQKISQADTNPEIAQLKAELAEIKKFKDEIQSEKTSIKTQEEDKVLTSEIDSIRKSFPNLDFESPDESGKSLETKILEHAIGMGLDGGKPGHFRAAFRDFYHDHLISKAREEGKELVAKDVQKRTKLGILGETPKPTKGLKVAENVRNKSYNDLLEEAKQEFGIA